MIPTTQQRRPAFASATGAVALALALSSIVPAAESKVVTYNWNITYVQANPDGLKERRVIGVNNQWPIPPIEVTYNDTLVLNVINQLDVGTSLHSHGLFQNGTVHYDGPSMVTQCPIPPGESFTYTFPIQNVGSYWIHGHNRGQYVDGLRAPFIVKNINETYKYDDERVLTLTDWYHEEHHPLNEKFLSIYNPTGAEPVPKGALINEAKDTAISFVPGKTYRLRIISMAAFAMFKFYIDGHDMQVIEVDGVETEPFSTPVLMVAAAQRYSVLVTARNATNGTDVDYLIHGEMDENMFDSIPADLDSKVTALITYAADGKPRNNTFATETSPEDDAAALDTALVPKQKEGVLTPDRSLYLAVNFLVLDDGVNHGTFNSIPYIKPKVPTLFTALTVGDQFASNPLVYGTNTLPSVLKHMEVMEIVVDNTDGNGHPFHLHGHVFQIVEINGERAYDPNNVTVTNPENPMRRDVVVVPGGGYAILRFRADNPGIWLFHCHIEWHLEAGLVMTFIEAPDRLNTIKPDVTFFRHCAQQGIPAAGNVIGKAGLDLSGLVPGPQQIPTTMTTKGWLGLFGAIISAIIGIATVVWFARPDADEVPPATQRANEARPLMAASAANGDAQQSESDVAEQRASVDTAASKNAATTNGNGKAAASS
ncbi:hypothetical protein HDU96_010538 [Phlyctochytrium bullatum]|nr:hypothetical protein HDU96_010538 [Phlyctochytrium bullatum]